MNTHYLSPQELACPHKVLECFFAQDGQHDNYLHLYHHIDRLVVAAWLLYRPEAVVQQPVPAPVRLSPS